MRNAESLSREQIREFLTSSEPIEFAGCGQREKYAWVERVLASQSYGDLSKRERGLVRAYLEKVTGMSASQMTRLIRSFLDHGVVKVTPYQRHRFGARYTAEGAGYTADNSKIPGGFGWDGGSGTAWRTDTGRGLTGILLTQRMATSPEPVSLVTDFWAAAYAAIDA